MISSEVSTICSFMGAKSSIEYIYQIIWLFLNPKHNEMIASELNQENRCLQ